MMVVVASVVAAGLDSLKHVGPERAGWPVQPHRIDDSPHGRSGNGRPDRLMRKRFSRKDAGDEFLTADGYASPGEGGPAYD
jgi:hypothetical protein